MAGAAAWENDPSRDLMSMMKSCITSLDRLAAQLCKHLSWPVEDAHQSPLSDERSPQELKEEFVQKVTRVEQAVAAIFQRQLPNPFKEAELYYLIKHVDGDKWTHLMRILEVTEEEKERCRNMSSDSFEQKYQMLQVWLRRDNSGTINFRAELISALELFNCMSVAQMFRSGRSVMSSVF